MRKKTKKYLITTESHEVTIVRSKGKEVFRARCAMCNQDVEMVNLDTAVALSGKGATEILGLIEPSHVHYMETNDGYLLVCQNSLFIRKAIDTEFLSKP